MMVASYMEWNQAIYNAVTNGVEKGNSVYLDTDDIHLGEIGMRLLAYHSHEAALEGFLTAVRQQCVPAKRTVFLQKIQYSSLNNPPKCIGFLAVLVLAAYDMDDDETASANNYFIRLRARLGLTGGEGRPEGLDTGSEESLWSSWNFWLARAGWSPTAYGGEGSSRYIQYARSQTLLRKADRNHLETLYKTENMISKIRYWDDTQHLQWLLNRKTSLTKNICDTLLSADMDRRAALGAAVSEFIESLNEDSPTTQLRTRRLRCGLYRGVHELTGKPSYAPLLQLSRGIDLQQAALIAKNAQKIPLQRLKKDDIWLRPLPIPLELGEELHFNLEGLIGINEAVFPKRKHWLLVRDPESPEYGMYGTWHLPELGSSFILLGTIECRQQLEQLKQEGVFVWGTEKPVPNTQWYEWQDCQILSPSWTHINPILPELFEVLKPSSHALGIEFIGGLRGPERNTWLVEYPPEIQVAVFGDCRLDLRPIKNKKEVAFSIDIKGEEKIGLPTTLEAEQYVAEFYLLSKSNDIPARVRNLRLLAWEELAPNVMNEEIFTTFNHYEIRGATVCNRSDSKSEETNP